MTLARQNTHSSGDYAATQKQIVQNYDILVTDGYYGNIYLFQ